MNEEQRFYKNRYISHQFTAMSYCLLRLCTLIILNCVYLPILQYYLYTDTINSMLIGVIFIHFLKYLII